MTPFEDADTTLTAGAPLLGFLEPAPFLPLFALWALGGLMGDRHTFHAQFLGLGFVGGREKAGIRGDHLRGMPELLDMPLNRRREQGRVIGALIEHFVVSDDLVFGFLDLDQFPKLIWFAGLAFADHLGLWFENTDDLALWPRIAAEHALASLSHDLPDTRNHLVQLPFRLSQNLNWSAFDLACNLSRELLGLSHYAAGDLKQFAIGGDAFFLSLFTHVLGGPGDLQDSALHASHAGAAQGLGIRGLRHRPRFGAHRPPLGWR